MGTEVIPIKSTEQLKQEAAKIREEQAIKAEQERIAREKRLEQWRPKFWESVRMGLDDVLLQIELGTSRKEWYVRTDPPGEFLSEIRTMEIKVLNETIHERGLYAVGYDEICDKKAGCFTLRPISNSSPPVGVTPPPRRKLRFICC